MKDNKFVPFPRRRRACRCSPPVTPEMASKIKTLVLRCGLAQHVVAARFMIDQGRVSEVVNGKRFPDAPFAALDDLA